MRAARLSYHARMDERTARAPEQGANPSADGRQGGHGGQAPALELAQSIRSLIAERASQPLRLADLSREVGLSPRHLQRTFKRAYGVTPQQYLRACRLSLLRRELRRGRQVTWALHEAGFSSTSRLYERARAELGMTPDAYRRGGAGQVIRFATRITPLGRLLAAATEHGVCATALADREEELEAFLPALYPAAELLRDERALAPWLEAIEAYLREPRAVLELPLDVRGTPFQERVWAELRLIPLGQTRSYGELARRLGQPAAYRAVAQACAANPAALLIPCHRVVRSDGSLGGYRWGVERKARLLQLERSAAGSQSL